MRLTTSLVEIRFALQLHVMKKLVALVVVLVIALNIFALMPKASAKTEIDKKECCLFKRPKIDLSNVNPGILPSLLKS